MSVTSTRRAKPAPVRAAAVLGAAAAGLLWSLCASPGAAARTARTRLTAHSLAAAVGARAEPPAVAPPASANRTRYPEATLSNGRVRLTLYLPDATRGYYRGPRFDWSGLVARAQYRGHTWFGPWKTPHNPNGNDDAIGPVEEFGMGTFGMPAPLGYQEARPGGLFLKIGVGLLRKDADAPYNFFTMYKIVQPGAWTVKTGNRWIEFHQVLRLNAHWAYDYTKRIVLARNRPVFTIEHSLRNLGDRTIDTTQYAHNFTIIDDQPIGSGYSLRFPFPVTAASDLKNAGFTQGRTLAFRRDLRPGEALFSVLTGFSSNSRDDKVTVEDQGTRAGLAITGDRPVARFHFYAVRSAVCPEPFVALRLAPHRRLRWWRQYRLLVDGR